MRFSLLRSTVSQDRKQWIDVIEQLPIERQDIYFYPDYLLAYVNSENIEACCAVYENSGAVLVYPFLKTTIKTIAGQGASNLQDIQSPYGYSGPVVNYLGEDPEFLKEAWGMFSGWCATERIISEFVRFHPLLNNVRWAPKSMKTFEDRVTIPIMLEGYSEAVQDSSYFRKHRQMLNKAARTGYTFNALPAKDELSWFVPLYLETQEFLNAGNDTRFELDYFKSLTKSFGSRAWMGIVKLLNKVMAAALVLEGTTYIHSHLMGYKRQVKTSGLTNLLYYGIAVEGALREKTILHMGGGLTVDKNDSLFRFKTSLSSEKSTFWIGTHCHDQHRYDELGRLWEEKYGLRPKNYFQFYRLDNS
jgi:hypothetical protein